ncbi:MAG: hypothetical protein M1839_005542 [Geoglossum umbratile]|nr:MAG: hypothetical protein M1839_005542 [Geoglossum umbratile]
MAPPSKKRRRDGGAVEEVVFDSSARVDYLTGFHKRKLQRIKHAKEEAAKREKAERITERRRLREQRKEELKNHVDDVNALLRQRTYNEPSDENGDGSGNDGEEEEWGGFGDPPDDTPAPIDHEDEYIDEDRYTTVTIESVNITKSGLHKSVSIRAGSEEGNLVPGSAVATQEEGKERRKGAAKERSSAKPKVKKKKFRYLSKGDRKAARMKERSGNKAKAKARRT